MVYDYLFTSTIENKKQEVFTCVTGQHFFDLKCALSLKTLDAAKKKRDNAVAKVSKNNEKIAQNAIAHPVITPYYCKAALLMLTSPLQ